MFIVNYIVLKLYDYIMCEKKKGFIISKMGFFLDIYIYLYWYEFDNLNF